MQTQREAEGWEEATRESQRAEELFFSETNMQKFFENSCEGLMCIILLHFGSKSNNIGFVLPPSWREASRWE